MKIHIIQMGDEKVMILAKITPYKHAILTSDAFEMRNTIETLMQSHLMLS